MHDCACSHKPAIVVSDYAETADSIDIDVGNREIAKRKTLMLRVACCVFVAQGSRERRCKQPVAGENPVVGVASRERNVGVLYFSRVQVVVHVLVGKVLAHAVGNHLVELVPVHAQGVFGVAKAHQGRSATATLHIALIECSRIGEFSVVEDVVDVETFDARLDAVEVQIDHGRSVSIAIGEVDFSYLVVVARLPVEQVDAQLRTIQAQVELLFVVSAYVAKVKRVAQEYPSPTKVGPELHRGTWRKLHIESVVGTNIVDFVGVRVLHHGREVVSGRLNVVGVDTTKFFHEAIEHVDHAFAERWFLHGNACRSVGQDYSRRVGRPRCGTDQAQNEG